MIVPELGLQSLYYALSVAFGAGGTYFVIRQSRKDINGIGRKLNGELARAGARHQNVTLALMLLAPEDKKRDLASLLKESTEDYGR